MTGFRRAPPIIDTGAYYPGLRDPQIPEIEAGKVESEWVAEQIGRPVIKAFNNILAYTLAALGRPPGAIDRLAIAVVAGRPKAKALVSRLVNEVGFDPVDAGTLAPSWRQQPSIPVYCCDYNADETRRALLQAREDEAPKKRNRVGEYFAKLPPKPTHKDIIAMNRVANAAG